MDRRSQIKKAKEVKEIKTESRLNRSKSKIKAVKVTENKLNWDLGQRGVKKVKVKEVKVREMVFKVTLLLDSPLWMRRCSFRWCLYLKAFPHSPHLNFRFSALPSLLRGSGGGG